MNMTRETFQKILPHIWRHEGGYVDHPRDPGGATNLGITHKTLARARGKRSVTKADVRALRKDEAAKIYKKFYWDRVKADHLPTGLDYSVFDMGVNAGPSRGIKILQKAVGSYPDGKIGPLTIAASKKMTPWSAIKRYADYRLRFYKSLRTFRTFGKGWTRRAHEVRKICWDLATGKA